MKLRNKKTGEVKEFNEIFLTKTVKETNTATSEYVERSYCKIAELNSDWEDYEPKEPLIVFYDDRKLVRHWAEVHNIKEVWVHGIGDGKEVVEIYDVEDDSMRLTFYRPEKMVINKAYTITELCGEEKQ